MWAKRQERMLLEHGHIARKTHSNPFLWLLESCIITMQRASRLKRELHLLTTEPPPGITCWQNGSRIDELKAQILGSANTPYEKGLFDVEVIVPERYPFEPPKMRFLTPIYHPNIDSAGRICLDVLKLPPKGAWRPSLNISTLLTSVQLLMNEPNPDDPLMADISSEYKYNKQEFLRNARQWTEKYASQTTMALETANKENHQREANLSKDSNISQKRKGSNITGLSKKGCSET
ncbi:ubiquitin-conjugating enzyme E2 T isoform X3 [Anolis carolinensis]|uniref:ubiquitin-conjugating enzyme E2 T isoform X3 n=2 Tax=Anolis carolinensis TaxID=28377 RepID=UPI002F2B34ED